MTNAEYLELAEQTLDAVQTAVEDVADEVGIDVECERIGNVLKLEFDVDSKIIVNLQLSMREIWIAAKSGGYHFKYVDGVWLDTRTSTEFFETLSAVVSLHTGQSVMLTRAL
ncbi:iron donor protein CyaY [Candidatus Vallotia cooleyia]|uniref:iron donor protein CyaY n=1 Tax=Candidatus Vallotiella adelgis TaxID=1177211 RepID=UPI001D00CEBB|nr:iron donor protein CyaY [Candidatus Vallotia cooleyia]UDG82271.1 Iron-sulfur cluster assembly protein CyaY [Candidatus Vallotia cooleyia]